jgi:hypothetical protein
LLTWHHPRPHQAKVIEFHDSAKQKEALQLLNRCSLKHNQRNFQPLSFTMLQHQGNERDAASSCCIHQGTIG